ncbi:MAG: hypothetical protein FE046_02020 [Thermoplasmata archaeon]|nr:MAG: hypothetical protein FE046_02020 [Thermoplasmata archaeon]
MEIEKKVKSWVENSCDGIFGFVYLLRVILDIRKFRSWLKDFHGINHDDSLFEGYKFMIKTLIGCLIKEINYSHALGLEEDFTYYRAIHYVDIDFHRIPNTCEKAVLADSPQNM